MKILICGDRNWEDIDKIAAELSKLNPNKDSIIVGGCRGADKIAEWLALQMDIQVITIRADWNTHKLAAGPIRNKKMLDLEPDKVIAFHSNINESKGTKNCINQAKDRNIPVEIIV